VATLDATTAAEYAAEVNAAARAQVIVDALTAPVYARLYDDNDVLIGEGAMAPPWAVASSDSVIPGTLDDFYTLLDGEPEGDWYFRFESGSRNVRLSFGPAGSGKEAIWSEQSVRAGTRAGISASAITVTGNVPPQFTTAPTSVTVPYNGGEIPFVAVDPNGDNVTYSLTATRAGITISPTTGIVTVASSAAGTAGSITVQASDGTLVSSAACAVTVQSVPVAGTIVAGASFESTSWPREQPIIKWISYPLEYGNTCEMAYDGNGIGTNPMVVAEESYRGSRSMKWELPATAPLDAGYRSSVTIRPIGIGNTANYEGRDQYFGMALKLANDYPNPYPDNGSVVLIQQHHYETGDDIQPGSSPVWALRLAGRNVAKSRPTQSYIVTMEMVYGGSAQTWTLHDAPNGSLVDHSDDIGVWRRWVFWVRYSQFTGGFLRIYRSNDAGTLQQLYGRKVTAGTSLEGIQTVATGTTRLGYYIPGLYATWRRYQTGNPKETVYWDEFRTAEHDGSVALVDPGNY
jgi:hypothetical protein